MAPQKGYLPERPSLRSRRQFITKRKASAAGWLRLCRHGLDCPTAPYGLPELFISCLFGGFGELVDATSPAHFFLDFEAVILAQLVHVRGDIGEYCLVAI